MGRFDALTQLDGNPEPVQKPAAPVVASEPAHSPATEQQAGIQPIAPLPDSSPGDHSAQPQADKKQRPTPKKPAGQQNGKTLNALQLKTDKFDKYSTYLRPGYKKELKSIALERDCKDYEILDEALTRFFATLKK